jgi:hypothetical protein
MFEPSSTCNIDLHTFCFFGMALCKMSKVEFEVRTLDGSIVGDFHVRRDQHVRTLKDAIAKRIATCRGSLQLVINNTLTRDCRSISAIASTKSHITVTIVRKEPVLSNPADCASFCTKCLIDAGASVMLLLQTFSDNNKKIDAVALFRAGFTLGDVVDSRARIPALRNSHPPPTSRTLFDSQLQSAGYNASDFRRIGYTACHLSETYFYTEDPEMTEGDREWDVTMAFFTPEQLLEAGFDAEEVRFAFNPELIIESLDA